ncbi:MAG: DNA polymerase III subunit delta' C-terminal domain-containing protein, partial [Gammaproteobacteria bacterium]|nr:DNA polymerase III subunit delta' C-terminal domain-containing protein [Gammaproteobacteria bacterium]
TIRSRCWILKFQPLNTEDIENLLIANFNVDEKTAKTVAPFAGGSVSEALNLLQHDMAFLTEKTILILRYSFGRRYHSAIEEFNAFTSEQGTGAHKILLVMLISWLNDLQKYRAGLKNYFFDDYAETLQKFNLKFSDVKLNEIVFKLDKYASLLKNNINLSTLSLNIITELSLLTQR